MKDPLAQLDRAISLWGKGSGFESQVGYILNISYNGLAYNGLVKSRENDNSIISYIINTLLKLNFIKNVEWKVSSRTDTGVSANTNLIYLNIGYKFTKELNIKTYLNRLLPSDIRVLSYSKTRLTIPQFRRIVKGKVYIYNISNFDIPVIIPVNVIKEKIELKRIYVAIKYINTYCRNWYNFCTYERAKQFSANKYKKHLFIKLKIVKYNISIIVAGRSFLSHQIRKIVGVILEYNKTGNAKNLLRYIFNKQIISPTASAKGLLLLKQIK